MAADGVNPPKFAPYDRVRVHAWRPPGHVRTPSFVRGRIGTVQEVAGAFGNPEELAYGRRGGARLTLYRVLFDRNELWPDDRTERKHSVVLDLYENWLEPAEETS